MKARLIEQLRRSFRPEFLNRVDEIIIFRSLTKDEVKRIVDILIGDLRDRLVERKSRTACDRRRQGPYSGTWLGPRLRRAAAAPALFRGKSKTASPSSSSRIAAPRGVRWRWTPKTGR